MDLMDEHNDAKYSVAWIDCLARGAAQGRSVLYLGEHVDEQDAREKSKPGRTGLRAIQRSELNIPFDAPSLLLNKYTMAGFNSAYYALQKNRSAPKTNRPTTLFSFRSRDCATGIGFTALRDFFSISSHSLKSLRTPESAPY
jgi:hypothetical protein